MTGFDEVMSDGFEERVRAITEGGGVPRKRARSVLTAIRRRRALRTGATTGVSLLAVGALALGATAIRPSDGAAPFALPIAPAGSPAWCDLTTYPAVNPGALADYGYAGRIYQNNADDAYMYVAPDGTHTVLEPDENGNYAALSPTGRLLGVDGGYMAPGMWTYMVWDFWDGGGVGLAPYALTPDDRPAQEVGPALMYEWTTSVSRDAPAGVDGSGLLGVHLALIGFTLGVEGRSYVPDGARIEQVTRWVDGREDVAPVTPDVDPDSGEDPALPFFENKDLTGLSSVSLRVLGLPEGESFEITSVYDPTQTWPAACGTNLNEAAPLPTVDPAHYGPYFEGPESVRLQCLAPLHARDEDVIPLTIEAGAGPFDRLVEFLPGLEEPIEGDLGTGGVLIDLSYDVFEYPSFPEYAPWYPGWNAGWVDAPGGGYLGATTFGGFAWVDADGAIIGRSMLNAGDETAGYFSVNLVATTGLVDGHLRNVYVGRDLATSGVACDGVDPAALSSATVVWVQGVGPDADHMTWSWTRVWPPS